MAGIIVDDALNKTDATIPNLDLIAEAEEFVMQYLGNSAADVRSESSQGEQK